MALKTLVVVVLRLLAIYWLIDAIASLALSVPFVRFDSYHEWIFLFLLGPCVVLFAVVLLWMVASKISSIVTKGHEVQVAVATLTKADIYSFAFIWLGLYFALSSISATVRAGYQFFTLDFPLAVDSPGKSQYLWPFFGHAFTLIAGFACIFGATTWANKLLRMENKKQNSTPTESAP